LIVLTVVTGMVDALAYLRLEHVFVANMTGYVVFLGFAAAGAGGLGAGVAASAGALPSRSIAAGRLAARLGDDRRRQLRVATTVELALRGGDPGRGCGGPPARRRQPLRPDRAWAPGDGG